MSKLIPTYIEQSVRVEQLERELVEAREQLRLCNVDQLSTAAELAELQAEIVRLKGEAESWEKVFDRACELLADTKCKLTEAVAMKEGK